MSMLLASRFLKNPVVSGAGGTLTQQAPPPGLPGPPGPPGDPHLTPGISRLTPTWGRTLDQPSLCEPLSDPQWVSFFPSSMTLTHRGRENTMHKLGKDICKECR